MDDETAIEKLRLYSADAEASCGFVPEVYTYAIEAIECRAKLRELLSSMKEAPWMRPIVSELEACIVTKET